MLAHFIMEIDFKTLKKKKRLRRYDSGKTFYQDLRDFAQKTVEGLYKDFERRIAASPPGQCPADLTASFLRMCHSHELRKVYALPCGSWSGCS